MGYPREWREFYERHLLPREGGYVPGRGTLLGVVPEVWVRAIPNIPEDEIAAQPDWSENRLRAIRAAAPSARPALVREWINGIRQHLTPYGNGSGQTFETVRAGGNAALVSGAHDLAFSVFYRQYIRGTGIEAMRVDPRTQETISDSCIRYGEGYAYSLLARAIVSSGIRTEAQLNGVLLNALDNAPLPRITDPASRAAVGYVPTPSIADRATYRSAEPGYVYTTQAGRRAVAGLLHDLSPAQQQALFDEFGKWRRTYDMNKENQAEREGDMLRTQALHGTYKDYAARLAVRRDPQIASAVNPQGSSSVTVAITDGPPVDMALVQASVRRHWIDANEYQIAIEMPRLGLVRYDLQPRTVRDSDGSTRTEYMFATDPQHRPTLPKGVTAIGPGQTISGVHNPYDGVLLAWRENGTTKTFVIGAEFNQLALDKGQASNTSWGLTRSDFTRDATGKLDPAYSAGVIYEGRLGERPGWVTTIPQPAMDLPFTLATLFPPFNILSITAGTHVEPERIPQEVVLTPTERPRR